MRDWYMDVVATSAFREGRIIGQGAWFTSGSESSWPHYQFFTSDLIALASGIRDLWIKEESQMSTIIIQASTLDQLNTVVNSMQGYTELRRGTTEWAELMVASLPSPPIPPKTIPQVTNQVMLNAFRAMALELGLDFWGVVVRCNLQSMAIPTENRGMMYSGPALEDLPLTPPELASLKRHLGL